MDDKVEDMGQTTIKRRRFIAGVVGAAAGAFVSGRDEAHAASGTGDQGALILGSNGVANAVGGATKPNISSVATDVTASPNFGNFSNRSGTYVLRIDARPSQLGNIGGVEAYGRGTGIAVTGLAADGFGVGGSSTGTSPNGGGVLGTASGQSVGLLGVSEDGPGVVGLSQGGGIGGQFSGGRAAIRLGRAAAAGPPSAGEHSVGELVVDSAGSLFLCKASGTPGTWVNLSAPTFRTLATPDRFVDTRSGLGGVRGPVPAGSTNTFPMTGRNGASANPALQIPDNAVTLVGNLTVLGGPSIATGSFVTLWPGGPQPSVSNINVGPGGVVANSFTVGMAVVAGKGNISVFNNADVDYILDITGFYA